MSIRNISILYLSLNSNLQSPFPKIDPLLISAMESQGCQIAKRSWGRHSEDESFFLKFLGRLEDLLTALLELIRAHHDILYVVTTLDQFALSRDIPLLLATYWFPVKKVLIEHGSKTVSLTKPGHFTYKFLTRLLIRLSDAILLLSSEEMEDWKDFEPKGRYFRVDNPFIQNNATKSDSFTNIAGNIYSCPFLLFVGRLIKPKGIFDLIAAMPLILRQIDCHLLIAGDGEEKEEIKRYIEKANLEQSVSLLGYLDSDHLSVIYKSTSVLILPTYFGEGFPTVISEAMSFGLPIVTTPLRGSRDHLRDEVNTLFVQPKNPAAIANAVVRLLKDPNLCEDMGRANLAKVQEFRPENVVPKYIEIFSELLGDN